MSVKHVSMWKNNKWMRITAAEAAKLFPHTVSSNSGLFICDLCQQYVTLVWPRKNSVHFRHSRGEDDKTCDDRTLGSAYPQFTSSEHTLPLKMVLSNDKLEFLIGFIPLPQNIFNKELDATINISFKPKVGRIGTRSLTYSFERLDQDRITYLPVGSEITENYDISIEPKIKEAERYWPDKVRGIDPNGTLFDGKSGKRLPFDADVELNHKYYLLTDWRNTSSYSGVSIKLVNSFSVSSLTYIFVYLVEAYEWCESAARFFIYFHARLTAEAAKLSLVWPRHITYPYIVKHQDNVLFLAALGESVSLQVYPYTSRQSDRTDNGYVYRLLTNGQATSVSIGRTKMLRNMYFWQENIHRTSERPSLTVTDLMGNEIKSETLEALPKKKAIIVKSIYDGMVRIYEDDVLFSNYKIKAGEDLQIGNLSMGTEIKLYIGNDLIRTIRFIKKVLERSIDEDKFMYDLSNCHSRIVPISHTFGSLSKELKDYPKIKAWLRLRIHEGHMDQKALEILKDKFAVRRQ